MVRHTWFGIFASSFRERRPHGSNAVYKLDRCKDTLLPISGASLGLSTNIPASRMPLTTRSSLCLKDSTILWSAMATSTSSFRHLPPVSMTRRACPHIRLLAISASLNRRFLCRCLSSSDHSHNLSSCYLRAIPYFFLCISPAHAWLLGSPVTSRRFERLQAFINQPYQSYPSPTHPCHVMSCRSPLPCDFFHATSSMQLRARDMNPSRQSYVN